MPKVSKVSLKKSVDVVKALTKRSVRVKNVTTSDTDVSDDILTPQTMVDHLKVIFDENRNPKTAEGIKKYMRGQFDYFGMMAPKIRELSKETVKSCSQLQLLELHQLLQLLWKEPERELQVVAIDCARKYVKTLCGHNSKDALKSMSVVRGLIMTKSWWDTTDMLACNVIGPLVAAHRSTLLPVLEKWIKDDYLWIRRTAIIHQVNYRKNMDTDLLFRYCLLCAHEQDFFIRKAIGWALRSCFRFQPDAVKKFVSKNEEKLSPLSKKEALRHA